MEVSCELLGVSRAAYYSRPSGKKYARELENEKVAELLEQIHAESPNKGYRWIKDDLAHNHMLNANEKRVLQICRSLDIKSTIKHKDHMWIHKVASVDTRHLMRASYIGANYILVETNA